MQKTMKSIVGSKDQEKGEILKQEIKEKDSKIDQKEKEIHTLKNENENLNL